MASSLGANASIDGWEVFYARSAIVTHAAAFDVQAIDRVYVDLHDVEGLVTATQRAMQMGYTGKQAIHPRQIEPIATVFTPTDEAIAAAQRVIDAYAHHQLNGIGAF